MAKGLGIDPGWANVGWAIHVDGKWETGTLVLAGEWSDRLSRLFDWLVTTAADVDYVAIERPPAGVAGVRERIAYIMSIVILYCAKKKKFLAEVLPVSHRKFTSGTGKKGPHYEKMVDKLIGHEIGPHERDAVSVLYTVEEYVRGTAPENIRRGVKWLVRKKRKK